MIRSASRWLANRSRLALLVGLVGAAVLALTTTATLGGFTASITNTGDKVASGSLLMQEQTTPTGGTTTTCLSTAASTAITDNNNQNCAANKFGAITNGVPGSTSNSVVVVTNQGSVTANSFSLGTGVCTPVTQAGAGAAATNVGSDTALGTTGFCGKVDVTIEDDTTSGSPKCIYPVVNAVCATPTSSNTLATLAAAYSTTPLNLLPAGTLPNTFVAAGLSRTYKVTVLFDATNMTNADQALAATLPITFTFGS